MLIKLHIDSRGSFAVTRETGRVTYSVDCLYECAGAVRLSGLTLVEAYLHAKGLRVTKGKQTRQEPLTPFFANLTGVNHA